MPIADDYKVPKLVRKPVEVLDGERLSKLFESASGTRLFPVLVLAAATGARRGELLALTWDDVDFQSGILNISKSLEETDAALRVKGTKSGKSRRFSIPQQALRVLQEHRDMQEEERKLFGPDYVDNGLVFCKVNGEYYKPDWVSVRVTMFARRAGLKGVGLHSLRHAHASELPQQRCANPHRSEAPRPREREHYAFDL